MLTIYLRTLFLMICLAVHSSTPPIILSYPSKELGPQFTAIRIEYSSLSAQQSPRMRAEGFCVALAVREKNEVSEKAIIDKKISAASDVQFSAITITSMSKPIVRCIVPKIFSEHSHF